MFADDAGTLTSTEAEASWSPPTPLVVGDLLLLVGALLAGKSRERIGDHRRALFGLFE